MKITKIRTIAVIYPWLSLEAEIQLSKEKYCYINFQYDDSFETAIDQHWIYAKPLNELSDHDIEFNTCVTNPFSTGEVRFIIRQMLQLFELLLDGKWDDSFKWHAVSVKTLRSLTDD